MPKNLVIIGAGGLCVEVIWMVREINLASREQWNLVGILDDNPERRGEMFEGVKVLGTTDEADDILEKASFFHCAISKNKKRERVAEKLEAKGYIGAILVHPTVVVGPNVELGNGSFIGALSILAPYASIGKHVHISTHVGVGHHSRVSDYSQLCPASYVNANCLVDKFAFIGSNATIQPRAVVGENANVGANSYVVRSVKPDTTVVGVPARTISRPARKRVTR